MKIRNYQPSDTFTTLQLFYDTVHTVNCRDYTKEQLDVWAPKERDSIQWNASFLEHYSLIVEEEGQVIGFGDIDASGYLDRFYIHASFQGKGAGRLLLEALEAYVAEDQDIVTHASITAKPFFIRMGYVTDHAQIVEKAGVQMKNYVMVKRRQSHER